MDFGIGSVVAITVITYLIGMGCKSWEKLDNKFIPVICGLVGAVLGVVGMQTMADFPAKDVLNALAVGIVSGLASTGANQIGKQLSGK
jgi:hypothetical protein|nr:MAG TPA: holin [Caudoviricetes sp.]